MTIAGKETVSGSLIVVYEGQTLIIHEKIYLLSRSLTNHVRDCILEELLYEWCRVYITSPYHSWKIIYIPV